MFSILKSEFRKLYTIRSTYVVCLLAIALVLLVCFYFEGYKGNMGSPASALTPTALQEIVSNSAGVGALFAAIIAVLFMAHEYRYNTIMYTLTANTRRSKVFAGKLVTIAGFGVVFGLVIVAIGVGSYVAGLQLRDASLPAQQFDVLSTLGRVVLYYVGYTIIGLLLAVILRAVVGAIAALLLIPTTIEPLFSLLLKENAVYLPFASLDTIVGASMIQGNLSSTGAVGVSAIHIAVLGAVSWLLFVRRDAN